jgi:hypothetical protein
MDGRLHVTKIDGRLYSMCCWVVLSIGRSLPLEDEHVLSFLVYSILYLLFLSILVFSDPISFCLFLMACYLIPRSGLERGEHNDGSQEDPAQIYV